MPVVVLTGMRQVGKSTLLQGETLLQSRRFFTLDDYTHLQTAKDNPDALLTDGSDVTIDEAQRCPELLVAVKKNVDRKKRPGRYLISGSANFSLLNNVSESLAGRSIYLTMSPFSRREINRRTDTPPFLMRLFAPPESHDTRATLDPAPFELNEVVIGGMPEVCLNLSRDRQLWFRGFEQTYLERDIRDLAQVADRLRFRNLLQLAALRTGQLMNISELGRDAGLNAMTASRYLSVMETSFVIRKLEPYLKNPASRIIKSPKLYLTDSGIACYLTGVEDLSPSENEPRRGALLETYVAQNLSSILDAHLPDARLYFWNIQGRYEVDFVIELGKNLLAIEVKAAARWEERDLVGLKAFMEQHPKCKQGILAYTGERMAEIVPKIWAVPIGVLLS
jgi:predicted AAA+ superfamily ATPase